MTAPSSSPGGGEKKPHPDLPQREGEKDANDRVEKLGIT